MAGRSLGRWAVKVSWKAERKERALLEGRTGRPSQDVHTESLPLAGSWHKHLSMENQPCLVPASPYQHYPRPACPCSSLLYLRNPRPNLKVTSSMEPSRIEPCWSMWHFLLAYTFARPFPAVGPLSVLTVRPAPARSLGHRGRSGKPGRGLGREAGKPLELLRDDGALEEVEREKKQGQDRGASHGVPAERKGPRGL